MGFPSTGIECQTVGDKANSKREEAQMNIKRIGIDIAKNVFQLHGVDADEKTVLIKKLSRIQFIPYILLNISQDCIIAMESCGGSHHWARRLTKAGYTVKLIPAQYVKPYVKRNKNDANDAAAICEASSRPGMSFVPIKTVEQQDIQALHRIRSELVRQRTAKVNQIRGLATEYGLVAPQQIGSLRKSIPLWLEDGENELSDLFRGVLQQLSDQLNYLDEQLGTFENKIKTLAKESKAAIRLQTLPGVGPLTATALIAAIGDGKQFKNGRYLAAWLGLTPRQHSSGGRDTLLGISKAGDSYLRTLLVHGARSVISNAKNKSDRISQWVQKLAESRHHNVVTIALANKNARIAWALLTKEQMYQAG